MYRAAQAVLVPMSDCTFDRDSMRMFQVVNNRPENRCLVPLPHLDKVRSSINVTLSNVGAHQPEVNKLIVRIDADSGLSLDLLAMVASIDVALTRVFRWDIKKSMATHSLRGSIDDVEFGAIEADAMPSMLPP